MFLSPDTIRLLNILALLIIFRSRSRHAESECAEEKPLLLAKNKKALPLSLQSHHVSPYSK